MPSELRCSGRRLGVWHALCEIFSLAKGNRPSGTFVTLPTILHNFAPSAVLSEDAAAVICTPCQLAAMEMRGHLSTVWACCACVQNVDALKTLSQALELIQRGTQGCSGVLPLKP